MATFIKPGFWEKRSLAPKHWLNLDQLITPLIAPKYKVYTALLSQSGTNAASAIVLENTIGSIVWSRTSAGSYKATLPNAFVLNKTHLLCGTLEYINNPEIVFVQLDENNITIQVSVNGFIVDNLLNNFSIEIRVYS
jgi:hypothetical protein